ncbi:MAG: hypothetical protein ACRDLO_04790 [Solirubrobacterales bacterium]
MSSDRWAGYGAAAGSLAIALYVAASLVIGGPPDFEASGAEVAAHLERNSTRIQVGSAINAASTPFFVWFLATVASLARGGGPGARRAGAVAFACGTIFIALFLVDLTALAVSALRPENMAAAPELAAALRDFEWLAMGMAAFPVAGMLAAFAVLSLRDGAVWPRWLGRLAALAALAYAMRIGTLFTTEGAFAADGVLGLWVPAIAAAAWILVGSLMLALNVRAPEPGGTGASYLTGN